MNFGQLIEYSIRNIFFQKSCTERGGEIIPKRFTIECIYESIV